ncbi:MAG TPA: sporulation transcriptional regulator SpoIIID [Candidatus Borkfalkia faecavium]|uniref:Sporulation transcriptional regulator SpoIIID n=1 Tax=Candidatus Borkfalkia faecavium TaxID=2838508 RepID=A0A9D2AU76_9FIRM|nr:sporulation transcriptional regulator SpoIIID [Candidatus Borkfalkia faecavium]
MWEYMQRRARQCAEYILETGATVRACAAHFGVSKSTVHTDVN